MVETREGDSLAAPQQPTYQYVWSLRYVDATILRDVYDGQGERQDDQRIYYLTDANHNVTALVGPVEVGQGQFAWQVVERYVYTPYGEVTIFNGTWTGDPLTASAYDNTVLFTGRELDPATGLYYYDARWYGPHLGQFVSRDVIVSADANPYRYVRSGPVNFTDPSGLGPCGQPVWDANLGHYVDPLYEQWAAEARARQRPARQASSEPGFWQGYWYYLWNPSKMDRDLRIAQKVALGTAAMAGGGAAGLAAGGAVTTWVAAGGASAIEASTAGGVVGVSVGSTTGYLIGRPLGTDVANIGALGGGLIGGFAPAARLPNATGSPTVKTRVTPGRDGAISTHTIRKDAAGNTISKTHTVTKEGRIVHQHQEHIGKYGGERRFPDEWTGTRTINAPPHTPRLAQFGPKE